MRLIPGSLSIGDQRVNIQTPTVRDARQIRISKMAKEYGSSKKPERGIAVIENGIPIHIQRSPSFDRAREDLATYLNGFSL